MEPIYQLLLNNGVGAFAAFLMYKIYMVSMNTYNNRIVDVIEKNTEAIVDFKAMVKALKSGELR